MKVIEVIANPYIALDKDGVPQGVVSAGLPGSYIGAQVDLVAAQKTGKHRFFYPPNKDGSLTRRVHLSGSIVQAVRAGELLAADKASARACGISEADYLAPDAVLASEKAKAQAYLESARGTGAKVADIPRSPTALADGDQLPVQTAATKVAPNLKLTKEG